MRYALYLDWENLWITHIKVCFPRLHVSEMSLPRPIASHHERALLAELPDLMMAVLRDRLTSVPRFSKAFAVWESLNYCDDMPSRLRQWNINPIQSLGKIYYKSGKRSVKECSDRALIIKVIEDVMLRPHARPEAVVIATGDFGFVPLIEFLMEHTDIDVYILSYRACLSQPLEQMITATFNADHVIVLDDHPNFEAIHAQCRAMWPTDRPGVDRTMDSTVFYSETGEDDGARVDVLGDQEFLFDLARALTRARMPYIDPGLVENRWCSMWEQHKTYSSRAALLFRRAIDEAIVTIENGEVDGRQIRKVVLNRDHPALADVLARVDDDAQTSSNGSADANGSETNNPHPHSQSSDGAGPDGPGSVRPESRETESRETESRDPETRDPKSGNIDASDPGSGSPGAGDDPDNETTGVVNAHAPESAPEDAPGRTRTPAVQDA